MKKNPIKEKSRKEEKETQKAGQRAQYTENKPKYIYISNDSKFKWTIQLKNKVIKLLFKKNVAMCYCQS